ncbi:Uncharacterized protein GY17_00000869 [Cryptosporidium hominis]|uniref:Uncharacterized protein n=1 Tax=Cryptosporidium hominis TaxID=237895 RepID=A0ABX5BJ93_CRYHO|nr:hypothetical protein [Cryptosporidium hominis TU502]PPS98190.1 Uncharacterized protein GY17_00000869 [Cryptosporidium hominis]|eukprot:PPS98190.1 Uncharacterized protein GY17_00000869 [Cryptosporidium hominis]
MGLTFCQTFQTDKVDEGGNYDNFPWSTCVNPGSVNTAIFPKVFPYSLIYYFKWFLLDTKMVSLIFIQIFSIIFIFFIII